MNVLFYEVTRTNICNITNDTTPHASGFELNKVFIDLEHDSNLILEWFRDNYMNLSKDKYHLLVQLTLNISNSQGTREFVRDRESLR